MVRANVPAPGEIWWLYMQPSAGKEQRGRHDGVIQVDQVKSLDWRISRAERSPDRVPDEIMTEIMERFAPIFGLLYAEPDELQ